MARLTNVFSWSFSAAEAFESCRRMRYWSKYAMWGGWETGASETQRKAYHLKNMDNIYSLQGHAAEKTIMWVLRQMQAGATPDVEQAYTAVAKPYLNNCWRQSKEGLWRINTKANCCLREHYYKQWDAETEKNMIAAVIAKTRLCTSNFIERVWPRLKDVAPASEVEIAGQSGDPESFMLHDVKIYAIPDYVHTADGIFHIHDWKSGRAKDSHAVQLGIYGLWANIKHRINPDNTLLYAEYLADGKVAAMPYGEEEMQQTLDWIEASVASMTEYLVDGNRKKNSPLPKEEWELASDPPLCKRCNFYELCKTELER